MGPQFTDAILQRLGDPARALTYYRDALTVYAYDPRSLLGAADAALTLDRPAVADTFFAQANRVCGRCQLYYTTEAGLARARGDSAVADTILARFGRLGRGL